MIINPVSYMSQTWMMTIDRNPERESIEEVKILQWILKHDVHDWIVAKETGTFGYHHWQIRMRTNLNFDEMKQAFPKAHIEPGEDNYDYEKKDGNYIWSGDTIESLQCRFGELRENQKRIMDNLDTQGDREIDVVIDNGNTGKTWLARHLFHTSKGFYVPASIDTPQKIIQFICSGWRGERIIVIDIARSTRWNDGLYTAMEVIKDGMIYDTRYHTTMKDIHGVKVLVTCNHKPNTSKLSLDRWRLWGKTGRRLEPSKRNTKDGSIPLGIEEENVVH